MPVVSCVKRRYCDVDSRDPIISSSSSEPRSIRQISAGIIPTVIREDLHEPNSESLGRRPSRLPSSESSSNGVSPVPDGATHCTGATRRFASDASIVLIGIRGTGKSSLAIIASAALRWRLVDGDDYFYRVTGYSRAAFKKKLGLAEYRVSEVQVMQSMLMDNVSNCVIACGSGSVEGNGQLLLKKYIKTHPVIHCIRDAKSLTQYLQIGEERVARLLQHSEFMYRSCSNLEFYNLSEPASEVTIDPKAKPDQDWNKQASSITRFLTLKQVEQDFLRFISHVTGHVTDQSIRQMPYFPPAELRMYTYVLSIPISGQLGHLDNCAADAIELVIDFQPEDKDSNRVSPVRANDIRCKVARVRRSITIPLIYTVRAPALENLSSVIFPSSTFMEQIYFDLLRYGLRLGTEYLVVDLCFSDKAIQELVNMKGFTKIIGDCHDSKPGSDAWSSAERSSMYHRAKSLGCDIVRLSQPATSLEDNLAVQNFIQRINSVPTSHPPLIAYNTGHLGRTSCCFNPILSPVYYSAIQGEFSSTGGALLTVSEAQKALYSSFILDPMHFYIFGATVSYSLSPAMHNAAFRACGMPHDYKAHAISSLKDLDSFIKDPNFGGASLTPPYKTEILALVDSMSLPARVIGAANTIIPLRSLPSGVMPTDLERHLERNRAGPVKGLYGDNTDWIGIRTCIRRNLSPANAITPWSTALVVGAGGMARAAIYAIIQLGLRNIVVYNRTVANAEKLAQHYNGQQIEGLRGTSQPHTVSSIDIERKRVDPKVERTFTVTPLDSLEDLGPPKFRHPTIIVSCVPAYDTDDSPESVFEIPRRWLESPTGGVAIH
ncbi:hypothetical protein MMC08_006667, partial [Hypocenomyce scalaris]|nr:hypothetical protein [Hypocenomyce scalaris]